MANRHLSRSIALQSLFEWDFRGTTGEDIEDVISRVVLEFGPGMGDTSFVRDLVRGVVAKHGTLDTIIEKAARDWPIAQTPVVDRNVLRIGLYELLYASKEEVPARVAINEAIELAKSFGGDKSGKFVNGVLGTVYKEMGEPGKYDEPKKKKRKKLTKEEIAQLPGEALGGALVYAKNEDGEFYLGLVHDIFGYWTLSKGRVAPGETLEDGTARAIQDELALEVVVKDVLGTNEYVATDPERGKLRKHVTYFLAETRDMDALTLKKSGGLDDAKWFSLKDATNLKTYEDLSPVIAKGINILLSK